VSIHTTVGATTEVRAGSDTIIVSEPEVGATLRTKGRFYFLCEVIPPGRQGAEIAREVSELARQEYYYDLSAGIEVSLRKALRDANRRAAGRLRDQHGRITLHCACAVIVGNTLYAARIGAAQIFLVRRARLFLPGDDPGELADFVHRTTTRVAEALGTETDLLPTVWKQGIEPQDTLIIAGGGLVDQLGAEALLNAAVTLHPRAAASHIHDRFIAEGGTGGDPALFIEVAVATGAAPRLPPPAARRARRGRGRGGDVGRDPQGAVPAHQPAQARVHGTRPGHLGGAGAAGAAAQAAVVRLLAGRLERGARCGGGAGRARGVLADGRKDRRPAAVDRRDPNEYELLWSAEYW